MSNERLYYDVLKRIAKEYMTTEQLQRKAEKMYGLSYHEALEMSYDNIQGAAADAIRGKRRPKDTSAKIVPENFTGATELERDSILNRRPNGGLE